MQMGAFLYVVGAVYVLIGAAHSVYFSLTISMTDCVTAERLVWIFCNSGMGISHAIITLGWPLYYFG